MADKIFTIDELKKFDGKEGKKAYVACDGKVYDVTVSDMWEDGEHSGIHEAGLDLSDDIDNAPHGNEVMESFPVIGILKG